MPKTRFISVDIESSGPVPGLYSMVSLGAWIVGEEGRTFYAELEPITTNYDEKALSVGMPGRTHSSLYDTGESPRIVMERFASWIEESAEGGKYTPTMVAHNAPFDWMFVAWYLWHYAGRNPFGWAALDTRALFMGLAGNQWEQTRLGDIKERFKTKRSHKHHALKDAIEQGELFQQLLAAIGQ